MTEIPTSKQLTRYDTDRDGDEYATDTGPYVHYTDAQAEIERLSRQVGLLQKSRDEYYEAYWKLKNSGHKTSVPQGDWLWGKLMDWCKKRGAHPADYNDLFAIVGKARAAQKASSESGWLVETLIKGVPHWYAFSVDRYWTEDPNEATRFAREEDADSVIAHYGLDDARATGHEWVCPSPKPERCPEYGVGLDFTGQCTRPKYHSGDHAYEVKASAQCQHLYHEPPLLGSPCLKCGTSYSVKASVDPRNCPQCGPHPNESSDEHTQRRHTFSGLFGESEENGSAPQS